MLAPRQILAFCLAVTVMSACSQGGTNAIIPKIGGAAQPLSQSALAGKQRGVRVDFRFKIPRRNHLRAHYLSPGTQSIEVAAYNATHTKKLSEAARNTVPGSHGCTALTNGTFVCRLTMVLPPGMIRIDATAFSGPYESANPLSMTSNLPVSVVPGKRNTVSLTLGGVVSSIAVTVAANVFSNGSPSTGFQFGGVGSGAVQEVNVHGLDADGYEIVEPGAPAVTLTSSAPSKLSVVAGGSYGAFKVTPLQETNVLAAPNPSTAVTLTAKATPLAHTPGSPVSGTVTVQNDPIVYDGTYNTLPSVQVYAPWSTSPILTLPQTAYADYITITLDPAGNAYVCNESAGTVQVFPPGSTTASRTLSGFTGPCYTAGVAVDAHGNLFVPEFSGNYDVKEFAPGSNVPSRTMPNSYPVIALDRSGNLYVANYDSTGISVYAPGAGTTPSFQFNTGMNGPFIPVFDSSGNLYVANYGAPNVTEYSPPFTSGSAVAKTWGSGSDPYGVAIDQSGNVYVGNDGSAVTEYAPGAPTTIVRTLSSGDTGPIAIDQLGNVYVGAYSDGAVEVYPPGSSTTAVQTWTTNATDAWYVAVWP